MIRPAITRAIARVGLVALVALAGSLIGERAIAQEREILGNLGAFEVESLVTGVPENWRFVAPDNADVSHGIVADGVKTGSKAAFITLKSNKAAGSIPTSQAKIQVSWTVDGVANGSKDAVITISGDSEDTQPLYQVSWSVGKSQIVHSGDTLKASATLKASGLADGEAYAVLITEGAGDVRLTSKKLDILSKDGSTFKVSGSLIIPAGAITARLQVKIDSTRKDAKGTFCIDDVSVKLQPSTKVVDANAPADHIKTFADLYWRASSDWLSNRFDVLFVPHWHADQIRDIHGISPETKLYMYFQPEFKENQDGSYYSSCPVGTWAWVNENKPEWYLKNKKGNKIVNPDANWQAMTDLGNTEYRQMWAKRAAEFAQVYGADGIYLDGPNSSEYKIAADTTYKKSSAWVKAADGFMQYTCKYAQSKSLSVVWNSRLSGTDSNYKKWGALATGIVQKNQFLNEVDDSPAYYKESTWKSCLDNLTKRNTKPYYVMMPVEKDDDDLLKFAFASYLLGMTETSYVGISGTDSMDSAYTPLFEIKPGKPLAKYKKLSSGIYTREYDSIFVVVNPGTKSRTITLARSYQDTDGNTIATGKKSLPAHTALILFK